MSRSSPSALITEEGRVVLLRLRGRFYEIRQEDLRTLLRLPAGPPGLGITIDRDQFRFDFAADNRTVKVSAGQLQRLLARQLTSKI